MLGALLQQEEALDPTSLHSGAVASLQCARLLALCLHLTRVPERVTDSCRMLF